MGKLSTLWQYQAAQLEKERLEQELRNTPARIKLNKLHAFLTESQNAVRALKEEIEQRTLAFEKMTEHVTWLEDRLELETSEFVNMQNDEQCTAEELTECRQDFEKLQKDMNQTRQNLVDLAAWAGKATADYNAMRAKAAKAKKEYDALRIVCDQELEQQKGAIAEAAKSMEALAEQVDPALLKRYQAVKRNHAIPMAKVENNQCSGCYMSLPMVVVKRVASHEGIVECENCGRILYCE